MDCLIQYKSCLNVTDAHCLKIPFASKEIRNKASLFSGVCPCCHLITMWIYLYRFSTFGVGIGLS